MTTKYFTIENALIAVNAADAMYSVQFAEEVLEGKTWEFDPNSDAIGQYTTKRTGKIKVFFTPVKETMKFPEDAKRPLTYVMSIEDARAFWKFMHNEVHFWFALDVASQGELHGFDADLLQFMENRAGCVETVETV